MSKKLLGYILFFVALLGGFFYFLFRGTDNWKRKLFVVFGERYGVPKVSTEKVLNELVQKFEKNKKWG